MKFKNFYEIGKWQGDRVGFPRVGIVNKELQLIKDSFEFLKSFVEYKRITIEIQRRNLSVDIENIKQRFANTLKVPLDEILISKNRYMKGDYIFRVFTQSRVLFREFQTIADNIQLASNKEIAQFLAGFADAEATIDTRNQIVSFSISNKKPKEAKKIKIVLEKVLQSPTKIRTAGKFELKVEVPKSELENFKEKIGKFIKHPEKIERLNGNFVSKKDKKYLEFLKTQNIFSAKDFAKHFKIHEDSARRILRFFKRQKLIF